MSKEGFIVSTAELINKLPTNTSPSKFLWSFKKAKRFKKTKPQTLFFPKI